MDYSGFDRENWPPRTGQKHREDANSLLACKTKTELEESKLGCRYSVLLKLDYFDAPRMLIVDSMHNLFLGSATKHFLKAVWLEKGVVSAGDCALIQDRVYRLCLQISVAYPTKYFLVSPCCNFFSFFRPEGGNSPSP